MSVSPRRAPGGLAGQRAAARRPSGTSGKGRAGNHARKQPAPEPLDLRLLPAAALAWLGALWATRLTGARPWLPALVVGALALALAAALVPALLRFHAPRHRADPRPGAESADGSTAGTALAVLLVALVALASVLGVTAADHARRARDPLVLAAARHRAVTIVGTVASSPRAVPGKHGATLLVDLRVETVDGASSGLTATVLGSEVWSGLPLGARVRLRAAPQAVQPGASEGALIGRSARPRVVAQPTGALGAVGALRSGLAAAAGDEGPPWPEGTRALVAGVALGDDHALPQPVREDMRAVSMTHLTAVSGQHVAIVLGLALGALGLLPRRARAAVGALVLALLIVLVRPSGSVLRAATMGAVMLVGVAAGRPAASVPAMSAGVLVLLNVDPRQAGDYGFALSVAATAGILLGSRPAERVLARCLPRWLAALVALPMVAQAACAPLLVLLQPSVGLWSVPANVLAAPVVAVATIAGMLAAFLAPWWGAAAHAVVQPALASCAWLVVVARTFAALPGATIAWPGGAAGAVLLATIEAAFLVLGPARRRRRLLAGLRAGSRVARALARGITVLAVARWLGGTRSPRARRCRRVRGLSRAPGMSEARGRLGPWHRPDPHAPPAARGARAHPPDRAGTRSASRRSSSSASARRS